ncbi:hypothetical protein HPB48_002925 [Haemaphysalis longicornis]|uniref:Laminin EGF-like domain-containing protein n=1 Tax=Haemaphysalis longicornis TaxID=44386 RepID=A0A9J6FEC9_HAELO|nr:hypothetical protein HPB48_002925 [Haemaphysalis longicornis]
MALSYAQFTIPPRPAIGPNEPHPRLGANAASSGPQPARARRVAAVCKHAGGREARADFSPAPESPRRLVTTGMVQRQTSGEEKVLMLPGVIQSKLVTRLREGTEYAVVLSAVYPNVQTAAAPKLSVRTALPVSELPVGDDSYLDNKIQCNCSEEGMVACTRSALQDMACSCFPSYTGRWCELCASGFFRVGKRCTVCPCSNATSTGECEASGADSVSCRACLPGHRGPLCSACAAGYHWKGDRCEPIACRSFALCAREPDNPGCRDCHLVQNSLPPVAQKSSGMRGCRLRAASGALVGTDVRNLALLLCDPGQSFSSLARTSSANTSVRKHVAKGATRPTPLAKTWERSQQSREKRQTTRKKTTACGRTKRPRALTTAAAAHMGPRIPVAVGGALIMQIRGRDEPHPMVGSIDYTYAASHANSRANDFPARFLASQLTRRVRGNCPRSAKEEKHGSRRSGK